MKRIQERLIDAVVLMMLLIFAYLMRINEQGLSGVIVMAAVRFWMDKNASEPHVTEEQATAMAVETARHAAALAAAEVLEVARIAADKQTT